MQTVVDVSHYQTPAQIGAALSAGVIAVFIKATEGTGYVDPEHDAAEKQVRAAGCIVGHYHFAADVRDALAEAEFFLTKAGPWPGDLVALDLEAMNGGWPERIAYATAWMRHVQSETGARPFWYVNKSWRSGLLSAATPLAQRSVLLSYPLWIATAGDSAGHPGVAGWALHQYSTAGGIDHDVVAHGYDITDYAVPGGTEVATTQADVTQIWTGPMKPGGDSAIKTLLDAVAAVSAAPAAAIDYDLLADKVADRLAARLAS